MFERDLPGENKSGLSFQQASDQLPLETCETINNSWGFNIADTSYKTNKQLIDYLVRASGYGANLLLNIGPMPNGVVQPEFVERLQYMGDWLKVYGESIYATKGGYQRPQSWGCITQKEGKLFVHVLQKDAGSIVLKEFPYQKIHKAYLLKDKTPVHAVVENNTATIIPASWNNEEPDEVVVLEVGN